MAWALSWPAGEAAGAAAAGGGEKSVWVLLGVTACLLGNPRRGRLGRDGERVRACFGRAVGWAGQAGLGSCACVCGCVGVLWIGEVNVCVSRSVFLLGVCS